MPNPWFRMYSEVIDDEKLMLLAFEDRWHYVALLACKNKGILDDGELPLVWRKVAVKLGLDLRTLEEVSRRLAEVDLIEQKTLQPIAWDRRQFQSDGSTERVKAYRERMKRSRNVSETAQDTDTDTDTEKGQKKGAKAKRFRPPSLSEVTEYCKQRGNRVDPGAFVAYYESNGWRVGRNKMRDWQAAVRTWEKRNAEGTRSRANGNGAVGTLKRIAAEDDPEELGGAPVSEVHGGLRPAVDGEYRKH